MAPYSPSGARFSAFDVQYNYRTLPTRLLNRFMRFFWTNMISWLLVLKQKRTCTGPMCAWITSTKVLVRKNLSHRPPILRSTTQPQTLSKIKSHQAANRSFLVVLAYRWPWESFFIKVCALSFTEAWQSCHDRAISNERWFRIRVAQEWLTAFLALPIAPEAATFVQIRVVLYRRAVAAVQHAGLRRYFVVCTKNLLRQC